MDIMEAERTKFVHGFHDDGFDIPGCIANGIPEETAEKIYDQMIDFAKYAFNKSHAAAYAAISMQTAYLKAHYPLEFAAGLLSSVMDDLKKLPIYVSEYRMKGFEVLSPDVNSSGKTFSPVGGSLCYGLSSIKNAGEDAVNFIISERTEGGPFRNYPDFVKRCWKSGKKTIETLIKAGALDFSGLSRRTMIENLEKLISQYKKEAKTVASGQMSLFDLLDKGSEDYDKLTMSGIVDLPEYDEVEKLMMEKEATGFYITGHPLDPYMEVLTSRYRVVSNQWFMPSEENGEYQLSSGDEIVIAGVVTENKVVYTKKDSKPMSIVTVEDSTYPVKVVFFPSAYADFGWVAQKDRLVAIRGKVKIDDRGISLFADTAFRVDSIPQDLYVRFKNGEDFRREAPKLASLAEKYSGNGIGSVFYCFEGGRSPYVFDRRFLQKISVNPDCVEEARKIFGEWNVRTKDFHLFPSMGRR